MNTSNAGSSGPLHVVSARLPTGDTPVAGVPLVPYVLVRRGVAGDPSGASSLSAVLSAPVSGDDAPDEETALATGSSRFALRFRWYRSVLLGGAGRGGMPAVCWAHPDREAAIQVRLFFFFGIDFFSNVLMASNSNARSSSSPPLSRALFSFPGRCRKQRGVRSGEGDGKED